MLCIKGGQKGDKNWWKHVRARYSESFLYLSVAQSLNQHSREWSILICIYTLLAVLTRAMHSVVQPNNFCGKHLSNHMFDDKSKIWFDTVVFPLSQGWQHFWGLKAKQIFFGKLSKQLILVHQLRMTQISVTAWYQIFIVEWMLFLGKERGVASWHEKKRISRQH